jgi:hypothetical protein
MSIIFSSFADSGDAHLAVGALLDRGARRDDIDLVASDNSTPNDDGSLPDGIAGHLEAQGVSADAVRTYHEAVKNGGALLALRLPEHVLSEVDAFEILARYHAKHNVFGART